MGLAKGSQLRKGNLVERLVATLRRGGKAQTAGGRDCNIGFACAVADSLLTAAQDDNHLRQLIQVPACDLTSSILLCYLTKNVFSSTGKCRCHLLQSLSEKWCKDYRAIAMQDSKGGEELMAEDNILQTFLAEQKDDLCGPRPQRTMMPQLGQESSLAEQNPATDGNAADYDSDVQGSALMQLLQQSFEVPQLSLWHHKPSMFSLVT